MLLATISLIASVVSPQDQTTRLKPTGSRAIAGDWIADANVRIDRLRKGDFRMVVTGPLGKPMSRTTVELEQINNDFRFGAIVPAEPATVELTRRFNTIEFTTDSDPSKISDAVAWFRREGAFIRNRGFMIDSAYALEVGDATNGDPDLRLASMLKVAKDDHPKAFRAIAVSGGDPKKLIQTLKSLDQMGAGFDLLADRSPWTTPTAMLDRWDALARAGKRIEVFDSRPIDSPSTLRAQLIAAFSHPTVDGLFIAPTWLTSEGGQSITEAYDSLVRREWRTKTTVTTDASGRAVIRGFYGTYRVKVGDWEGYVGHSRYPQSDIVIRVGAQASK